MTLLATPTDVSCAVEVFIATALLHHEQPNRPEFTIQEIVRRAAKENITGELRQGVSVHASQHCVANKAPNPNRHKMLFASGKNTRRLLLPGDEIHPDRSGKVFPDLGEVPERYLPLLEWARKRFDEHQRINNESRSSMTQNSVQTEISNGRLQALVDAKGVGVASENLQSGSASSSSGGQAPGKIWLEELLNLRLAGAHLADGVDPDEHIRQLREGWD